MIKVMLLLSENQLKNQKSEKAEALLDEEMQKPTAARNKALLRKYGLENTTGIVDKYPNLSTGDKYQINVHIPEDPNIPLELRPKKWFVTIVIPHNGSEYNFIFPISRANQPGLAYKLDGYDVFLDDDYNVIVDATPEYDLYEALLITRVVTRNMLMIVTPYSQIMVSYRVMVH
jgi:hypothetical protein